MKNLILLAVVMYIAPPASAAQVPAMVRNGGFEQDSDNDGMADHWKFAGDQGVVATCKRDAGYQGRFSQRLTCEQFAGVSPASHAMMCQFDTLRLEKGKWYRISFAARQRSIISRAVSIAISNTESWTNCGLREAFRPSSDWKEFAFVFKASQTITGNVRLQFWYTSTGSLWLDEVKLEPSGPPIKSFTEVVAPLDSVNLLPNSSFECGLCGWGSIAEVPGWGGNLNLPVGGVDTSTAKFHSCSYRIALTPETIPVFYFDYFPLYRVPVKAPLLANRGWITVEKGAPYTFSAYIKADSEDLTGVLSIYQAFGRTLQRQIRLKTTWTRHAFTFEPGPQQVFVALGLDLEASRQDAGTVWIDAVQLEKGSKATAYQPRSAVEVGLQANRLGNIFPHGKDPIMTATVFNADRDDHRLTLNIRTTNFDDKTVHRASVTVPVAQGQRASIPVEPGVRSKGFYRLHIDCEQGASALTRPIRFAIIDPYEQSDSLFGMNHAYPWPHLLDLSRQIGICWFRDWSLKWHDVEPRKGSFDFTECDHQIDRVLRHGLNVIGLLPFPSTNWSSSAGPEVEPTRHYPENRERVAYMPKDLKDMGNYVRNTVEHYRDRLSVWEILNEPVYTSYALPRSKGYNAEDYVRLLKVAYRSVKAVDADALVIGGIAGSPTTYTNEFIKAGGLDWVDALNLHMYPGLKSPDVYEEPLQELRRKMRSAGADKPIWFTEGAYYADDDIPIEPHDSSWLTALDSEVEAAECQIKLNTLLFAYGVRKIIYHSGTPGSLNNESLSGIFFEWAGAPRKMLVTQVAMANLLRPPVRSLGRMESPENIKAYGFETQDRMVMVAWLKEGLEPTKVSLAGKKWRAIDLQGNELDAETVILTERPMYFIGHSSAGEKSLWQKH